MIGGAKELLQNNDLNESLDSRFPNTLKRLPREIQQICKYAFNH
jgi:hypothetical protein